jgi:2-aminoadipate transaminase
VTLTRERRKQLVEMADAYGVPIVEDDPYGQLRFEGEHQTPVVVIDDEMRAKEVPIYSGNVIYTSTFSKILAPGLRLAWVVAPTEVIKKLVQSKQGCDLHTATFTQYLAYQLANSPWMKQHIGLIRKVYKERRDTMLEALETHMPEGVSWTHPKGGLFLWATLPDCLDSRAIFNEAVAQKVAFVPGGSFHPLGGGSNTMRLNFSNSKPEMIQEGIERLAKVIKDNLC